MHLAAAAPDEEEAPRVHAGVEKNSPNAPVASGRADVLKVLKREVISIYPVGSVMPEAR